MTEKTRKKIVYIGASLAIVWAVSNYEGENKTVKPVEVATITPLPERVLPSADKLVLNVEQKRAEKWGDDPFRSAKRTQKSSVSRAAKIWKLSGIMFKLGDPSAFINGRAVRAGDTIDGARVVMIKRNSVTLENNKKLFTLHVVRG